MARANEKAAAATSATTESATPSLVALAVDNFKQTERGRGTEIVDELMRQVMANQAKVGRNTIETIESLIEDIDARVSQQLAAVMHKEEFQKLEGSWRGLNYLVMNSETSTELKLRVLHCSKDDLLNDFRQAKEFDQSETFKKIYAKEFDQPGGTPYGALVGDYEFTKHNNDIEILRSMSGVAAAGLSPFIAAASPALFGLDDWTGLDQPRDLAKIFDTEEYIKWTSFRKTEDSRFVCLTLPRTLARQPYGKNTDPISEFDFEEVPLGPKGESIPVSHQEYAWMNSAYVLGTRLTNAFSETGWLTSIRGAKNGGKVENLPVHVYRSPDGDLEVKCPTEVPIRDRRENELSGLGFLSLGHYKNTDYAVFIGAQTTQKPEKFALADATENASICARLPYILTTSRFSHYLKVMARDWIGSNMEREDVERKLHNWIFSYVSSGKADEATRARFPLQDAQVKVQAVAGKPGSYEAVVHMRPWLQFEELTASMRLVAKIPKLAT